MVSKNVKKKKTKKTKTIKHSFWIQIHKNIENDFKTNDRWLDIWGLCIQVLFLVTENSHLPRRLFYANSSFDSDSHCLFTCLTPNLLHNLLCVDIWYTWRVTAWQLNVWICTISRFNARMLVSLNYQTNRMDVCCCYWSSSTSHDMSETWSAFQSCQTKWRVTEDGSSRTRDDSL